MPQGIALPTPFPPAIISPSVPVCELIDDGSTSDINYSNPERSTITQTVKVTGLDDTNAALGQAIEAALLAFPSPTYQPFGNCMVVTRIEPSIGIDGVRRQSMIAGRGATDDNNTTGTVAVFRLVYGFPTNLGGSTSYQFVGGGITYEENTLDPLESTGSITVSVTGPTTSALAKAQAVAMFPTHPNNASLGIVKTTVRYEGGGTCQAAWIVFIEYACQKASAYGIVANTAITSASGATRASLTIKSRGNTTLAQAISDAQAAYPAHPNAPSLPFLGWYSSAPVEACDGLIADVTLQYANSLDSSSEDNTSFLYADITVTSQNIKTYLNNNTIYHNTGTYIAGATGVVCKTRTLKNGKVVPIYNTINFPLLVFRIPYNTATSILPWAVSLEAFVNSNTFSVAGYSFSPGQLRFDGMEERIIKDGAGNFTYKNTIVISAAPHWLADAPAEGFDGTGTGQKEVEIFVRYANTAFTVPPVPPI